MLHDNTRAECPSVLKGSLRDHQIRLFDRTFNRFAASGTSLQQTKQRSAETGKPAGFQELFASHAYNDFKKVINAALSVADRLANRLELAAASPPCIPIACSMLRARPSCNRYI